jgi:hypothetical protein
MGDGHSARTGAKRCIWVRPGRHSSHELPFSFLTSLSLSLVVLSLGGALGAYEVGRLRLTTLILCSGRFRFCGYFFSSDVEGMSCCI